jgi:hypothetical protein
MSKKRNLTEKEKEFYYKWQHIELLPMEKIAGEIKAKFDELQQIKKNMSPNDFLTLQVSPDLLKKVRDNKIGKYLVGYEKSQTDF